MLGIFLLILIGFNLTSCEVNETICNSYEEDIKFWISTTRNELGEWISEGGVEHPESSSVSGWNIFLNRETIEVDQIKYFRVYATISPKNGKVHNQTREFKTKTSEKEKSDALDWTFAELKKEIEELKKILIKERQRVVLSLNGYNEYSNGKFYKIVEEKMTWSEAIEECKKQSAYLVLPQNDQDKEVLEKIKIDNEDYIWTGYNDIEKEGVFLDVFGMENNWWRKSLKKYDDSKHKYNCGILGLNPGEEFVYTSNCDETRRFICQIDTPE